MARRFWMPLLVACSLAAGVVGMCAPASAAPRSGTAQIISAARAYVNYLAPRQVTSRYHVRVSTRSRYWAMVSLYSPVAGAGMVLLRESGGVWYPQTLGTGFTCGQAPPGVMRSFGGPCQPDSTFPPGTPVLDATTRFAVPCGDVTNEWGTFHVFIPFGPISCAAARSIESRSQTPGWWYYDWTKDGSKPWSDVWQRHDGMAVVAAILA
jgi:hypothetical protein